MTKEQARGIYGIKSKSGILKWMRKFAGRSSKLDGFDPIPALKDMENTSEKAAVLKVRIKQLEQAMKASDASGKKKGKK